MPTALVTCDISGGTFALYSLISRHAKISLIPNQLRSDARISSFRLKVPCPELERSLKLKEKLENSLFLKKLLLVLVLAGTSMVIADGVVTPAMSGSYITSSKCVNRHGSVELNRGCYYHMEISELLDLHNAVMSAVGGLKVGVDAIEQGTADDSVITFKDVPCWSCIFVIVSFVIVQLSLVSSLQIKW